MVPQNIDTKSIFSGLLENWCFCIFTQGTPQRKAATFDSAGQKKFEIQKNIELDMGTIRGEMLLERN